MDQVVLKVRVLNQEKIPDQYYSKILDQKLKSWFTKYLNLIIKNKSRYIHDFFESLNNNASSSAVIAYFNKVFSIWISTLHTYILFIIFFSVSMRKDDLNDKIFIENQLATKTNQLTESYQFVQSKYSFLQS